MSHVLLKPSPVRGQLRERPSPFWRDVLDGAKNLGLELDGSDISDVALIDG